MQALYRTELRPRCGRLTLAAGRAATAPSIRSVAMAEGYDVQAIEARWQRRWRDEGTYEIDNDDPRPPFYVLCMYPYPSGPAHMGHVRNYTFGDLIVRYRTMHGHGVLSPIGFDSFGLPGGERGHQVGRAPPHVHRRPHRGADVVAAADRRQLRLAARGQEPRPAVHPLDPVDLPRFLEAGLAYRKMAPVNWCPGCQTVLANEQVLADGTCERSGDVVEQPRPRAVVLQDHRLRRPAARRPRRRSTGPSGSSPCSATGSAAPRAPSSTWWSATPTATRSPAAASCGSSPPVPTRASA